MADCQKKLFPVILCFIPVPLTLRLSKSTRSWVEPERPLRGLFSELGSFATRHQKMLGFMGKLRIFVLFWEGWISLNRVDKESKFGFKIMNTPRKTNTKMENQPFGGVSPIKNGDFPASHLSFRVIPWPLWQHHLAMQGRPPSQCMAEGEILEPHR